MALAGPHVGASLAWIFALLSSILARQLVLPVFVAAAAAAEAGGGAGSDFMDGDGDVYYADSSYYDDYDLLFDFSPEQPQELDVPELAEDAVQRTFKLENPPWPSGSIFPHLANNNNKVASQPTQAQPAQNVNARWLRDTESVLTSIPARYLLLMDLDAEVSDLTGSQVSDLKSMLSGELNVPQENIHFSQPETEDNTLALYFVWPDAASSLPHSTADLIPAVQVQEVLAQRGMAHLLPSVPVQSVYTASGDGDVLLDDSTGDAFWTEPFFPYVAAAVGVAVLLLTALCVWCCVCRQRKQKSGQLFDGSSPVPVSHGSTKHQQICLYPTAKPSVNSATMIQPEIGQIKSCSGTPVKHGSGQSSGTGTPTYSSSQSGTPSLGTPITGCGTPVHTPPLRLKAKGLLERRGSNASLTIDLTTAMAPHTITQWGSPPRESSAEEYLLSAGNRMNRKQLRNCLRNTKGLHEEFWEIPMNHPDKIEVAGSGMKNRYRTIIPNEHSRVKLPEADGDPLVGYINANYIRGYAGEATSYIATQGPMSNTVEDFWWMVWQEKVPTIVMITKLKEKHRTKCESYLPERYGVSGDIEIFVHSISEGDGYILRRLTLKYLQEEQKVLHYWYTAWPDHKAPNTARQLLDLVREVDSRSIEPATRKRKGPVLVHCSAGIGRTGCFIATSICVQQLREERMVDVLGTVCGMRLDRGGMVQTNEQYEFVHQALCLYEKELPNMGD